MSGFFNFSNLFTKNLIVKANDEEEELVDPMDILKEDCKNGKCKNLYNKLEECNTRVNSKKKTTETCMEELYDLLHCVDHCLAKPLFEKLK